MNSILSHSPAVRGGRFFKDRMFIAVCLLAAGLCISVLCVLLGSIILQGMEHLDLQLLQNSPSRKPDKAGIYPAMIGTIYICSVCAFTAIRWASAPLSSWKNSSRPTQRSQSCTGLSN